MTRTLELFAGGAARTTAVSASTGNTKMVPFKAAELLLDVTAMGGAVGDTLDVYVDVLVGTKWLNAAHFTQVAGNGAAQKQLFTLNVSSITTSSNLEDALVVTSDAAAGKCRSCIVGDGIRGRYTLVDAGAHGQSATFGLYATLFS